MGFSPEGGLIENPPSASVHKSLKSFILFLLQDPIMTQQNHTSVLKTSIIPANHSQKSEVIRGGHCHTESISKTAYTEIIKAKTDNIA